VKEVRGTSLAHAAPPRCGGAVPVEWVLSADCRAHLELGGTREDMRVEEPRPRVSRREGDSPRRKTRRGQVDGDEKNCSRSVGACARLASPGGSPSRAPGGQAARADGPLRDAAQPTLFGLGRKGELARRGRVDKTPKGQRRRRPSCSCVGRGPRPRRSGQMPPPAPPAPPVPSPPAPLPPVPPPPSPSPQLVSAQLNAAAQSSAGSPDSSASL
jgi:hypothetical protein